MLLPLLVQNLGPATGSGDLDFTVVEVVRDLRLEGAAIVIDGVLAGYTRAIGVFRSEVSAGSHTVQISLDGYNSLAGSFDITAGVTTSQSFAWSRSSINI
jgi:PEGA domain.